MEFGVLGSLEVREGGRVVPLARRRQRVLLAVLLLRVGEVVSVDRLLDDLWGASPPPTARASLQNAVSSLRKLVGGEVLRTQPPGYLLALEPDRVDARRFERLLGEGGAAARQGEVAAAAATFGQALALWRGPALAEFAYEPFAQVEIARLEELRRHCLEGRIEADLALGRQADLVAELEALVAAQPRRERLRALLMLALYRLGRQADALATYRAGREALIEELGIEPGPELRALEAAVLRQEEPLMLLPAPAVAAPAEPEKRKLVVILFADVVESMALAAELDPEALRALLNQYFGLVSTVLTRHGGRVEKFVGDAVLAAFGVPVAHEDDALRAARAALELQAGIAGLNQALAAQPGATLAVRIGIEAGEVLAGGGEEARFVTGAPVGVAARLEQAASPGEIVLGQTAARLIAHAAELQPLGPLALRGRKEPLPAFRLLELDSAAPTFERRLDAPLIGRAPALAALDVALEDAVSAQAARALLVLGPAGIGKSRLAEELAQTSDAAVCWGRCVAYGEGITYWPLRTILGEEEFVAIVGAPSAEEIAFAFRRHCEELARERPLLLVLDDLHWAEPSFLELVEYVVAHAQGPIFLLCLAREEFAEGGREFLSGWERLLLGELGPVETEALLAHLLRDGLLPDEAWGRIIEAAGGNPLFLEQLVAFVAEDGVLGPERPLPPTIQALLAARLDRLGPGERSVLECAAVVGDEFRESELAGLLEPAASATVGRHLEALVTRGFIRTGGQEKFRFRHVLIQDAVYRATPKQERAPLHERFADLLSGNEEELDELVGHHLEQAFRYKQELGQRDSALAERAGERLAAAGRRAGWRGDDRAAGSLLERALELTRPLRLDVHLELDLVCACRYTAPERSLALAQAAAERAHEASDEAGEALARVVAAHERLEAGEDQDVDELETLASIALPLLEQAEDHAGLVHVWLARAGIANARCRYEAKAYAAEQALRHARLAGQRPEGLFGLEGALHFGPTPADEAVRVLDAAVPGPPHPWLLLRRALLLAMLGRFDEAWPLAHAARERYGELMGMDAGSYVLGEIAQLAGDHESATGYLSTFCEWCEEHGQRGALSTYAPMLGRSLCALGRYDEAEPLAQLGRELEGKDDLATQMLWRRVQALVHARRGEHARAERLACEAVAISERTDGLNFQADALYDLAEVQHSAGRIEQAATALEQALDRYQRKRNDVMAANVRAHLAELTAAAALRF